MPTYKRLHHQIIPASRKEVWTFLADPRHLLELTPETFDMQLLDEEKLPSEIYRGLVIHYTMKIFRVFKTTWTCHISDVVEGCSYIDEQPKGPFRSWHHEHRLEDHTEGTLMVDTIHCRPPFGFIGAMAYHLFIKKRLDANMDYRTAKMAARFKPNSK